MENTFAKLFEFENQQVVIIKDDDTDDDSYKINQITKKDDIVITIGMGYMDEDLRDQQFIDYDRDAAEKFMITVNLTLFQMSKEELDAEFE